MAKLPRIALLLGLPSILAAMFLFACQPDPAVQEPDPAVQEPEATPTPEFIPPCGPDHNIDDQLAAGTPGDGNNRFEIDQLPADYVWETVGFLSDRLGLCYPPGWTLEDGDLRVTLTPPNTVNGPDASIDIMQGGTLLYFLPPASPDQDGTDPFRPDHALEAWINGCEWAFGTESPPLKPGEIITATIGDREFARAVRNGGEPGKVTIYTVVRQDNQINGARVTLPYDSPHQALYEQIMNSLTAVTPDYES